MYKMNYRTDIVNFLGGGAYWRGALIGEGRLLERGAYWRGALISKILLSGGALIGEGRLSESGCLLDHLL